MLNLMWKETWFSPQDVKRDLDIDLDDLDIDDDQLREFIKSLTPEERKVLLVRLRDVFGDIGKI